MKRSIFFMKNNQLYVKNVEVHYDKDATNNKQVIKDIENQIDSFLMPSVNLSSCGAFRQGRSLSSYSVKMSNYDLCLADYAKAYYKENADNAMPGLCDYWYLNGLTEEQVQFILASKSFYDIYYNPDRDEVKWCPARACVALQMLNYQNKIDYIGHLNDFLYWYWVNCRWEVEYINLEERKTK